MVIQELHLEMTRNCSLYCEHCLRGEKACKNISKETIDNVFKDVTSVYNLLLTGGEPLIAVRELEYLIDVLKSKKIKIGKITLVTNGTIMSARVLRILKELCNITYCRIDFSNDIFHRLEAERLGLSELVNKNIDILKELFGSEGYGDEYEKRISYLSCGGRAELMSKERLAEINSLIEGEYIISPEIRTMSQPRFIIHEDSMFGYVPVDIYGNIVSYGQSFVEEDSEAAKINTNVNQLGFKKALDNFVEYINEKDVIAAICYGKK